MIDEVTMLDNLTLTELNAMTKEDIISAIVAEKPQTTEVCTKATDGVNGQVEREYVTKDLAGAVIKTEKWGWKYDKAGVVSEITKIVLDSKSVPVESVKIVDGKIVPVKVVEAVKK